MAFEENPSERSTSAVMSKWGSVSKADAVPASAETAARTTATRNAAGRIAETRGACMPASNAEGFSFRRARRSENHDKVLRNSGTVYTHEQPRTHGLRDRSGLHSPDARRAGRRLPAQRALL